MPNEGHPDSPGVLRRATRYVFGSWSWAPPPWLRAGGRGARASGRWANSHRKTVAGVLVALVVLGGSGYGGWRWWERQPKPVRFSLSGDEPAATPLEENARPYPLRLQFGGSAARLEQIGKVVAHGVTLSPALAGEWRWSSDRELVFTPAADWAVGQEYTVALDKTLFPEHVLLETYQYRFHSAPFTATLKDAEFYQDPANPKIKRVEATLAFSHVVNSAELTKHVALHLRGAKEPYPFTVTYNKLKSEAFIHSGSVVIPLEDTALTVSVSAGLHAARGGPGTTEPASEDVSIPGMFSFFHVNSATPTLVPNERFEPEQVVVVEMSAGATEEEIQKHVTAWLLPKDIPSAPDHAAQKNVHWNYYGADRVGDELLKTRVALQTIPTDKQYATTHSFKYKAPVGQYVLLRVTKGALSYGGYVLAKDWATILQVPAYPQEVKILHDGALLSLSGEKKLSVLARGMDAVRFEVARVLPGEVNHLVSQSYGSFNAPGFQEGSNFNEDDMTERLSEVRPLEKVEAGKAQYAAFDFTPYLGASKLGLFFFQVQGWDAAHNRARGPSETRFVLVTDLGLLAKTAADGSRDLFVESIHDGTPGAAVSVDVLGRNGLPIASALTDAEGHAHFPSLSDFLRERAPTVYVARRGQDVSFMPYDRADRRLDFTRFDTGGVETSTSGERLSAYLFSDRGLYRPGDTFHVALIVKPTDWTRVIAGVPLEAAVTDARGLEVQKQKLSLSAAGFEDIHYQTEETSPTGTYAVSVYVVKDGRRGTLLGSTNVRVEEFLPDRMKISTRFSTERLEGWVSPAGLKGLVSLQNLFGTPAEDRRVVGSISLSPSYPGFRPYRDYTFFDPLHAKNTYSENLPEGRTDEKGEVELELNLDRFEKATYLLNFTAQGFEAQGGRGVSSESSVLVSPMAHLVGYKADGDLRYLSKGSARTVDFIAVEPALKKVALAGLKAALIEQRYVSALVQQSNGTYRYESVRKEIPLSAKDFAIAAQGTRFTLPTDQPGDFILVVREGEDTELARVPYSVVGKANLARALEKNAELEIKLAHTDYSAGDDIELEIKAPYTGAGLITIERDRVYAWKWFKTTTTSSTETIRMPAGLEGNAYVNVSFVRALDSQEIFMSPLSYGVAPFSISRANRINQVELSSPDIARPGEPYRIKFKGQKAGKVVVFAVDEGILQVAAYRTPDPLSYFFKKRALQVSTEQILDQLLPELSVVRQVTAAGGDEGGEAIGKNLNPFKRKRDKPVAYWSGILNLDTTEHEVVYDVPDSFNGSLRVMAVAVSPDAVGVASKKAIIRGHFVLSPNVPTFVAPGDEFQVSVGLSNNVEGSGQGAKAPEVTLQCQSGEALEVLDGATRKVKVAEGHETSATFQVRAKEKLGSANLTFVASLGDKHSKQSTELSVRPSQPFMTTLTGGWLKSSKADVPVPRTMYPEYRTLEASASPLPIGLARGLVSYLQKYPYGCTEQLVSQAFPAIVLRHRPEFGYDAAAVETNLSQVIRILRARQNAEGAFGFWAANSFVSDFQTVYALHFLTEAREKGYSVPPDLLARGLMYLKTLAERDAGELPDERTRAYALYVLTRNGVLTTSWLTALREELDKQSPPLWKKDLTGAYLASTYKLLKQDSQASKLMSAAHLGEAQQADYENFYDGQVYDAQLLYLLARHFPERIGDLPDDALPHLAGRLLGDALSDGVGYNTLSSSYTILGLDAYVDALGPKASARGLGVTLEALDAAGKGTSVPVPPGLFPKIEFPDVAAKLRFASKDDTGLFYQATQAGFDRHLPSQPIVKKLEVQREYQSLDGKPVTSVALGAEVEVHLKIRALAATLPQVAIVDLLPGGFEVVLQPASAGESEGGGEAEVTHGRPAEADEGEAEGGEGDDGNAEEREAPEHGDEGEGGHAGTWVSPIGSEKSSWQPDYADVREDRVVLYGSVTKDAKEFVYRIKATNQGSYSTPPIFAESMYDRTVQARGVGAQFVVTKP